MPPAPTVRAARALPLMLAAVLLVTGTLAEQAHATGIDHVTRINPCWQPAAPRWFHRDLVTAIRLSGDLPMSWASAPSIPRIICWQDTGFDPAFHARGNGQRWHGLFAMTVPEVQSIAGPWMSATPHELILSPRCFVGGWAACPKTAPNERTVQQLIAGLRWIWIDYGTPSAAWRFILRTGRFTSYPRPGTDDTPTGTPLTLCPVAGPVTYQDDLGEPRGVGGFHPHWGNDIHAPIGRPIRAPFDGFAVAHSDDWFAGHYVTVTGTEGYVRNGHMSRFGTLGWVKAGTVIGYVGETGDARSPHDHFEWHPWNLPRTLHRSPYGYSRVLDGIDPYPFLNQVCH